jgi:hypothetical protein
MTPRELRRAMRERRGKLRAEVSQLRRQARERADQNPAVRRERRRRRTRRALLTAGLLLLLSLLRCDCGPEPVPPVPEVEVEVEVEPTPPPVVKKPAPAKAKRPPLSAKTEAKPRNDFAGVGQPVPAWLDDFRLQVAARSARLAQCFTGSDRPGALRWSTSVNPENGAVSEHELEPVGQAAEIGGEQRACVLGVLSSPAYRLTEEQKQGLPKRISLVIEF